MKTTPAKWLTLVSLLAATTAPACVQAAESNDDGHRVRLEIAPFAGFRLGGDFEAPLTGAAADAKASSSMGLVLDFEYSQDQQLELLYSVQSTEAKNLAPLTEFDVEYLQIGGSANYPMGRWTPFVTGTLGATRFSPEDGAYDEDTNFSLSFGGGVKYFLTDHFGLKLESRAFLTLADRDQGTMCASGGGACLLNTPSRVWWQVEAAAGFVVRF